MTLLKHTPEVVKILHFLKEIDINIIEKKLSPITFLPGLSLGPNCIEIDFERLLYPGDILHEAGHIAVTTAAERKLIGSDNMPKDWPTPGDEIVAILWSYGACCYLQLPIEFVFHPNGYKNESNWLIENYTSGSFIGLPLLEWMGLTLGKEKAAEQKKDPFPAMVKWLRD